MNTHLDTLSQQEKALFTDLKSHLECFYQWEKEKAQEVFLRQPQGDQWKTLTWAEAGQEARKIVTALQKMGLQKGDHIGILSKNCYHWILADLAIMMGGYVSVPFYASLAKKPLGEVIIKSDIKALFVGKLDAWGDRGQAIPEDVQVIRFPHYPNNAQVNEGKDWDTLVQENEAFSEDYCPDLEDLWTILFTSGTTGTPKGVMHTFRTPAMQMRAEKITNFLGLYKIPQQRFLSFLPLNHVGERIGVELPALVQGGMISFAESLDSFAQNLQDTQPTTFFAVPRIWTKFYLGVLNKMPQKRLDFLMKIPIISGMVKRKLLKALGMSEAKVVATGAAITPGYLKKWYKKLGIHLIEAYGMTEVCGSMTNSPDLDTPLDSVGRAIPYGEVKIHPESGEILMKSPFMMKGYYNDPEKTAEVLIDGWMHSGDRGELDENGYLKVVGRVKDAFKTAKGKYVVPNPIEEKFSSQDCIEQVCVAGLGIPQPLALVNLSEMAQKRPQAEVQAELENIRAQINQELDGFERISTVIVCRDTWSDQNQLLTPTLKIRRGAIDQKYLDTYEKWHEAPEKVIYE